ncbi:hypothetical protein AAFF_G00007110 [Aldrovandia affinis]|uniref:Uncharacterized protein n=1 Tax=Aldrovandia affinis TaxID=143900 RepID=A0AAD7T6D9_9TELE|nr:hypothetical protein AAFF_G00007110 [Aldrovandia affinis]
MARRGCHHVSTRRGVHPGDERAPGRDLIHSFRFSLLAWQRESVGAPMSSFYQQNVEGQRSGWVFAQTCPDGSPLPHHCLILFSTEMH